jgi:serine/threonine protein kinase/S1-C subfamily serine protease
MSDQAARTPHDPLDAVIAEYLEQVESGAVPDREALLTAHPEIAERLRAFFADFDRIDRQAADLHLSHGTNRTSDWPGPEIDLPRIRYFGDYELLEVIARGGMGVVYKARQVSLNRVVALKMLLAGEFATKRDAARFQAEAEAAAALDHPHIVPIFEIGEHEGRQYFSMKYVDGCSLSKLPRDDVRGEAERLIVIARAVQFAHERGVLHRDLKPGNVLIDSRGAAFVADFGLAKRADSNRSLSESGAMVGTPRYMAPEQAAGRKDLTVAADIYSLGVVLYERLTGTTPFNGNTAAEIMFKLLNEEPISPRQHNRAVPRDLETICLHCLHKDPAKRYATAAELADDLQRFVAGDPVRARPLGLPERVVRWGRRHRTALLASSSAAAAIVLATLIQRSPRPAPPLLPPPPTVSVLADAPEWLVRAEAASGQLSGTCWRTMEQNVLATSMAALGMPNANSPRPSKLEVCWKLGKPEERVFAVDIAKVDEAMQVVMLRLQGDNIPKPRARPIEFSPAVVERAKESVVQIRSTRREGVRFGSGFVAQPGLVVSVAHVFDMQRWGRPPPEKIEVVAHAGTQQERLYEGELLVVDRNENLAVIRIQGPDLPKPLPIVSSSEVEESQRLVTLGYPTSQISRNLLPGIAPVPTLKARQVVVAGRMMNTLGIVKYLQIEGGSDPGNSGAAVIDTNGEVVAVHVVGVRGAQTNFVVPSDYVTNLLQGRVLELQLGVAYRSKGSTGIQLHTTIANPTRQFNAVSLEMWTSPAPRSDGSNLARLTIRPASNVRPIPLPGDGPIYSTRLDYDLEKWNQVGEHFSVDDFILPDRKKNEVYWVRPRYHLTNGGDRWGEAMIVDMGHYPVDLKPATLASKLTPDVEPNPGRTLTLDSRCTVDLEGAEGSIGSNEQNLHATLNERVESLDANGDARVRLHYVDVRVNDADRGPKSVPEFSRKLDLLKKVSAEAVIAKDGRMRVPKTDWSQLSEKEQQSLIDINSRIMNSLEMMTIDTSLLAPTLSMHLDFGPLKGERLLFEGAPRGMSTRSRNGRSEALISLRFWTRHEDEKKGSPAGTIFGDAAIDLTTGQVILGRFRTFLSADFAAGQINNNPVHAEVFLETTLRRTSGEAPATLDPNTMLPGQTIVLSPLVGVGGR